MPDVFSSEKRSEIMSNIRGKDTKPELKLRSALHSLGYRYSLNHRFKDIRCTPDMVLVSRKVCIFVDGCFWHACPKCYEEPKSNREYWVPKIQRNRERDREQDAWLKENGWLVIRVWSHEIRDRFEVVVKNIDKLLVLNECLPLLPARIVKIFFPAVR